MCVFGKNNRVTLLRAADDVFTGCPKSRGKTRKTKIATSQRWRSRNRNLILEAPDEESRSSASGKDDEDSSSDNASDQEGDLEDTGMAVEEPDQVVKSLAITAYIAAVASVNDLSCNSLSSFIVPLFRCLRA